MPLKRARGTRGSDWRALSAALAERVPAAALHGGALAAIRAEPAEATIAIACSGGADSVALALALWAHLPERRGHWLVLHFNHRLRGRAADADARFVRALARGLGERCVIGVWRRPSGEQKKISEADARDARLAFFRETMRAAGARVVALGHQRDDVAETMLMRLARGSGAGGLAAPRSVQRISDGTMRVRPLLDLPAIEIRAALRASGAPWREDTTNAGDAFLRNRIRRRVLPALVAASPQDALAGFAAARAQLEDDDDALHAWLAELIAPPARGLPYDVRLLAGRPRALVRRAVHAWLQIEGLGEVLGRIAVEEVVAAITRAESGELRRSAGTGGFVVLAHRRLSLEPAGCDDTAGTLWPLSTLRPGTTLRGPLGDTLNLRMRRLIAALRLRILAGGFSPERTVFLDASSGGRASLSIRSWLPGDRYRPLGAPGSAKLQDLFVNKKVPREQRGRLPVVCDATGSLCWVPGLPPAHDAAVQPGSKLVVQLTYLPAGTIVAP